MYMVLCKSFGLHFQLIFALRNIHVQRRDQSHATCHFNYLFRAYSCLHGTVQSFKRICSKLIRNLSAYVLAYFLHLHNTWAYLPHPSAGFLCCLLVYPNTIEECSSETSGSLRNTRSYNMENQLMLFLKPPYATMFLCSILFKLTWPWHLPLYSWLDGSVDIQSGHLNIFCVRFTWRWPPIGAETCSK
jgi:hypothetical protein